MSHLAQPTPREAAELLGEPHPLLEQLGSVDGLFSLHAASASLRLPRVNTRARLARFLEAYCRQRLFPLELPAIERAHHHTRNGQTRELIALDQRLGRQRILEVFASASQRVGRSHLLRLRPLRGERVVQRYLEAVEAGEASGWHTLVYGLTLAVYSLPVRQGLLGYARQTVCAFVHLAARPLRLSRTDCDELLGTISAGLPAQLESILQAGASTAPRSR
jgi:urease accessory protein UreF